MKTVKIFKYYAFGHDYKLLLNFSEEDTHEQFFNRLKSYFDFIKELELKVTLSCINLKKFDTEYETLERLLKKESAKKKEKIPKEYHTKVIDIVTSIDATLDAEINIKTAFIPNEKRHSFAYLTEKIDVLFGEKVFTQLPSIAQYDFQESGRCLAFDRFTAASFHALRGTEDVLKFYYSLLTNSTPTDNQTWYDFANEIEKEVKSGNIKPAPPADLILNFDSLRKYYRNKTQHPQLIYSSDDSQDLFSNCIKCVNQTIFDLRTRKLI